MAKVVRLNRISDAARFVVPARFDITHARLCGCRLLLLFAAIELITMPLTQHFWAWDHFLHGGRDFETGLLLVVTLLCFVLLRTHRNQEDPGSLLAIGMFLLRLERSGEGRRPATFRPSVERRQTLCSRPDCIPLLI
jgi:hypothetical protein